MSFSEYDKVDGNDWIWEGGMESGTPRKKAIIIGAGIGGLTTALFYKKSAGKQSFMRKKRHALNSSRDRYRGECFGCVI